jgi:tRNA-2-methylthio-N6-dimethylallyladenosine synthase
MPSRSVYLETFGCQMNELDSELVQGSLRALGYRFTGDADAAEIVLYNTCSVREHAEQKVWSRLGELAIRKREQPGLVVGVLGCLAERDGVALVKRMPVVDVLCGPGELDKLPGLIDNAVRTRLSMLAEEPADLGPARDEKRDPTRAANRSAAQVALQGSASRRSGTLAAAEDTLEYLDLSRAISPIDSDLSPVFHTHDTYTGHAGADAAEPSRRGRSAYVRITRGCNKFCTYCVVPFTRGAEIHRPPDHIVDECKRLGDAGVIEVTLLGQTVNHYRFEHGAAVTVNGVTQPQKGRSYKGGHRRDPFSGDQTTTFADLLSRIHDEVPAIKRLRFVTSYPRDFGDDVLEAIRDHPRICRYLHVPAQSGSDRLLQMMNRGYSASEYLEFLDRARGFLHQPEIGRPLMVSGDFIVGFPTETESDYAATVDLMRRARYKNSFIFKYSPRPGTTAYDKFADDVSEADKRRRNNDLLAIQGTIGEEIGREQIGSTFEVLIEGVSSRERKRQARVAATAGTTQTTGHAVRADAGVSLTIGGRSIDAAGLIDSSCTDPSPAALEDAGGEPESSGDPSSHGAIPREQLQFSGRTDGDLIVFIDAPSSASSLIGTIRKVRITQAKALGLHGALISD